MSQKEAKRRAAKIYIAEAKSKASRSQRARRLHEGDSPHTDER